MTWRKKYYSILGHTVILLIICTRLKAFPVPLERNSSLVSSAIAGKLAE